MEKINKEIFLEQLKVVINWTEHLSRDFDFENSSYGKIFRQVNPGINNIDLYSFDGDYTVWNVDDYDVNNYQAALSQAISIRYNSDIPAPLQGGKILCFTIGFTTHDGVATVDSNCFIDESDVPPIDTWFYLLQEGNYISKSAILFCWIPIKFQTAVQKGIDAEIMDSYFWLEDLDPIF